MSAVYHWMRPGCTGADVCFAKQLLAGFGACSLSDEDVFDGDMEQHIREFQKKCGITADGLIGPQTWEYLAPAVSGNYGGWNCKQAVYMIQEYLKRQGYIYFRPDGIYGVGTRSAVQAFQKKNGLHADGIWEKDCWRLWFRDRGYVKLQPKFIFKLRKAI